MGTQTNRLGETVRNNGNYLNHMYFWLLWLLHMQWNSTCLLAAPCMFLWYAPPTSLQSDERFRTIGTLLWFEAWFRPWSNKIPQHRVSKKSSKDRFSHFSIDAEETTDHVCQFVNDADDKESNAKMRLKVFNGKEYLCLYALRDISPGQEILYNYGDEINLWWRKQVCLVCTPFCCTSLSERRAS